MEGFRCGWFKVWRVLGVEVLRVSVVKGFRVAGVWRIYRRLNDNRFPGVQLQERQFCL